MNSLILIVVDLLFVIYAYVLTKWVEKYPKRNHMCAALAYTYAALTWVLTISFIILTIIYHK